MSQTKEGATQALLDSSMTGEEVDKITKFLEALCWRVIEGQYKRNLEQRQKDLLITDKI